MTENITLSTQDEIDFINNNLIDYKKSYGYIGLKLLKVNFEKNQMVLTNKDDIYIKEDALKFHLRWDKTTKVKRFCLNDDKVHYPYNLPNEQEEPIDKLFVNKCNSIYSTCIRYQPPLTFIPACKLRLIVTNEECIDGLPPLDSRNACLTDDEVEHYFNCIAPHNLRKFRFDDIMFV